MNNFITAANHQNRNSNIELLRFVLMLLICVGHLFAHGLGLKYMGRTVFDVDISTLVIFAIVVPAVNCFMLISGYYGMNLKLKKVISFIVQAIIYFWIGLIVLYL